MTILDIIGKASMAVGLDKPSAVFGSTEREWQEMQVVANEALAVIVDAYDWQRLQQLHTMTSVTSALPDDYRRMKRATSLWHPRHRWAMTQVVDSDEWIELTELGMPAVGGYWCLFDGKINFAPGLLVGETAKFFYIKDRAVKAADGTPKAQFEGDEDVFVLNPRLLRLAIVYLWKQAKGQDFAAELADYEIALNTAMLDDRGAQSTVSGNTGARRASSNVWPGTVNG